MIALKFYPVFVDHIATSVEPRDLRHAFSKYGPVVDVVIVSSHGFVNMESPTSARDVIYFLNGTPMHGNLLHVDYSEELKQYLDANNVQFRTNPDPVSGRLNPRNPSYPDRMESPFFRNIDNVPDLLHNRDALEDRLRRVNRELDDLDNGEFSSYRSRSGSPSNQRRPSPPYRSSHYDRDGYGESRDRSSRESYRRSRDFTSDSSPRYEYELFVGGLHNTVHVDDLQSLFEKYAIVVQASVEMNTNRNVYIDMKED